MLSPAGRLTAGTEAASDGMCRWPRGSTTSLQPSSGRCWSACRACSWITRPCGIWQSSGWGTSSPPPPPPAQILSFSLAFLLQETELLTAQQELDLLRGDLQSQRHLQVRTDAQGDAVDWKHTAEVDAAGLLAPGVAGGSAPGGDNKIESAVGQGPRRERRGAAAGEARGQGAREEAMHCMQRTDKAAGPAQTAPACFIFPP